MTNALKGTILSGLILPGLGQLIFKQYFRAAALMLTVLGCLVLLTVKIIRIAFIMIGEIESGSEISLTTISDIAMRATMHSFGPTFSLLFILLLASWVIGVLDAYATGRKMDRKK